METITISKKQYQRLLEKALRYEYLQKIIKEKGDIFAPPPTRNGKEVIKAFQKTNLYSSQFLKSLEKGLKRSSYFKK
ncbi:MAG: hypothetical protein ACE5J0_00970 [Candidatus Paceibacterales bacterium]